MHDKPLSIVFVVHHELVRGSGAAGSTIALAEAMQKAGHNCQIVSYDDLPKWINGRLRTLVFPIWAGLRLLRLAESGEIDIVDSASMDAWLFNVMRSRNVPVSIFRSHGLEHIAFHATLRNAAEGIVHIGWRYRFFWGSLNLWQTHLAARTSDACILLNRTEQAFACRILGVPRDRTEVIPHGLDAEFFSRASDFSSPKNAGFRLVYAGGYVPLKGVSLLAKSVRPLLSEKLDLHLRLIGTGVEREVILRDYDPAHAARIEVIPRYSREELLELLADCDALVLPSTTEGFGKVLVEAMACGVVPIASKVSGPRDVLRKGGGFLVQPRSARALTATIRILIEDPALLQSLSRQAVARAKAFTLERQVQETLITYRRALRRRERLATG